MNYFDINNKNENKNTHDQINDELIFESDHKKNIKKRNLMVRFFSSIILIVLLLIYVLSGFIYTKFKENSFTIATAYVAMLMSVFLVSFSCYELFKSYKLNAFSISLGIILANLFFLCPINQKFNNFLFYMNSIPVWYNRFYFILFGVIILIILQLFLIFYCKKNIYESILIEFLFTVIVFGIKGFVIFSFSKNNDNNSLFSFNTNLWIWGICIFTDSFAYFGGLFFGKHQFSKNISPNKTWEGAVIGYIFGFIFSVIYSIIFYFYVPVRGYAPLKGLVETIKINNINLDASVAIYYIAMSIFIPFVAIIGDLLFSFNKRINEIKDYSLLIPGHGGVLDRLDSVMLSLSFVFIAILLA